MSAKTKFDLAAAATRAAHRSAEHLLGEIKRTREERDSAGSRMARSIDTLDLVLGSLPEEEQRKYRKRLLEITSDTPSDNRGSDAYGKVVALFRNAPNREWSVPDVFTALRKARKPPETKAVYNALNYLEKSGRLIRIGRGRYYVRDWGAGYETVEDLPSDGTERVSEHDV